MPLFEPILQALNRALVRYVVVGGVAVVLHGHIRSTVDLDLIIDLSPDEARSAIDVLVELGLRPSVPVDAMDFADPVVRGRWIEEKGMLVFSLRDPNDAFRHVDVFTRSPIDFEELWSRSDVVQLSGLAVRVASIPDLISLKRAAGRAQDLADIEKLEIILRERRNQDE
ncbi:MAG: DUF6036 family nucleotidyltransferase [Actinomycetota bacterium]